MGSVADSSLLGKRVELAYRILEICSATWRDARWKILNSWQIDSALPDIICDYDPLPSVALSQNLNSAARTTGGSVVRMIIA
jgi:hypothetical protein